MRTFIKFTSSVFLLAIIITASIAAAPATLATPGAPTAQATANGGEMTISWNQVPGAQYYTVGWVNWTDAKPISDAGEDWLSQFYYTTVLGSETSYTVKGLDGGDDHYAIVRATDIEGAAGRFGGGWSMFSAWSLPVQPADFTESSSQPTSEEATIPGRPTASAECYVGQQLTPGQSCWFSDTYENPDPVFAVTNGGPYHGYGQWWFSDGFSFDSTGSHAYLWTIDSVDHIFEVTRQDSVWVVEQYGPDTEQPSPDGSTVLNIPGAPENDCYVGLQIGPGEGCVVPDPDDPNQYRFHGSVVNGGDYHGRFIKIDDGGEIELSRQDATMVINTNYPGGADFGYRFEAKKIAGDVWEIVKVNEQVQRQR